MQEFLQQYGDSSIPIIQFLLLLCSGVGIPIGEDIVNIPAGMLAADNNALLWPVLIAAYVGVVCGDALWFIIVSRWGAKLLHVRWFKRLLHPRRLLQAKYRIDRYGAWIIVLARFIPASRTTTITVAGMLHLPFWKFFIATVSCVLITAPIQVGVGWLIGRELATRGTFDLIQWTVGLFLLASVIVVVIWLWRRQRRHGGHPPRARVAWLKQFRRSN
ncbi:MAG: DedA family protein [Phycisphaerales bacterium]|nr:DedA family protein [Phycisphaerales bacterium]